MGEIIESKKSELNLSEKSESNQVKHGEKNQVIHGGQLRTASVDDGAIVRYLCHNGLDIAASTKC